MRHLPLTAIFALGLVSSASCTPSSTSGPAAATSNQPSHEVAPITEPGPDPEAIPETVPEAPVAHALTPRPHQAIVAPRPTGPYRVRIVDASSRDLPTYDYRGRRYVMGTMGQRYSVVVSNPTSQRVEAVVSVDGLDAVDGTAADYVHKRGYILAPYGETTIDGFRTSVDEVATFRFSSVADSYAGRTGQARDVGVVGVAFFPERAPEPVALPRMVQPYDSEPARRQASGGGAPAPMPPASPTATADKAESRASGSAAGVEEPSAQKRRGLGTEFGEARDSHVERTEFVRADSASPRQIVAIRYNDRAGLARLGIPITPVYADYESQTRETADPFRTSHFASPPPPRSY